ncbi:MAG TPA: SH3 domain-containing protein [Waterburya sp.]|jgi:uncharacterized protein YgiM (DUF1202 family)
MKKYLVFAVSSAAIVIAASSALAVGAGSNPVGVNAQSGRTGETITPSNRFMPSQTTQEFQPSLNQDKSSRQFLISERIIGCGTLNDPKPPTNVRSGPGTNYKVVASLPKGALVSILQRKNGWVKITTDSTTEGWVAQRLVTNQRCPR